MMTLMLTLHILATIVWIGGMFFAHMVLRPASIAMLEPNQRLQLWSAVFKHFFYWVWIAIIVLITTGVLLLVNMGGFKTTPIHIHVMAGIAGFMVFLYCVLYFIFYMRFRKLVENNNYPAAASTLNSMRLLVVSNLTLGIFTVVIATAGGVLLPMLSA